MKILVVEDNPVVREAHIALLQNENYEVDSAEDGKKAIRMAKNDYDVILMDLHLPHLDGIDITTRIRQQKHTKNPIIIGITSDPNKERYKMCLQAGMDEVLQKPVTPEQILSVISKASLEFDK